MFEARPGEAKKWRNTHRVIKETHLFSNVHMKKTVSDLHLAAKADQGLCCLWDIVLYTLNSGSLAIGLTCKAIAQDLQTAYFGTRSCFRSSIIKATLKNKQSGISVQALAAQAHLHSSSAVLASSSNLVGRSGCPLLSLQDNAFNLETSDWKQEK